MSAHGKLGTRALVHGKALPPLPVSTLGAALERAAGLATQGEIVHIAEDGAEHRQTYADLLLDARRTLAGIRAAAVPVGSHILLRVEHAPDLFPAFWACVLGGFVPVPVNGAEQLLSGWRIDGDAWLVADRLPPGAPVPDRWIGGVAALRGNPPDNRPHRAEPTDVATVMLTAGSSGHPKGVLLSHDNVLSRSVATAEARGLDSANRSFNWMPLEHVGGLVMFHLRDVFLGCQQVHAPTDWVLADPLRWLDAMSRYRSTTTWAPNFAFGLVAEQVPATDPDRSWDLRELRYIMNGGEPVKARVAHRFLDVLAPYGLPATAIHPGWGMSETSSGVIDNVLFPARCRRDIDRYVPVGTPHPGVSIRVVDEDGRVNAAGAIGRLQISGRPVTTGYLNDPVASRAAFTDDGWFIADDLAFIEDGVLTVTGRADDVIEVDGQRYHGHEIEAAVEELPLVEPSFTVVCAAPGPTDLPQRLGVFFHPRPGTNPAEAVLAVRETVRDRFRLDIGHVEAVEKDEIPKTNTGKIRRSALVWRLADAAETRV